MFSPIHQLELCVCNGLPKNGLIGCRMILCILNGIVIIMQCEKS